MGRSVTGSISTADPSDYYAFQLEGRDSVRLRLDNQSGAPLQLLVRYAAMPGPQGFDERSATPSGHQETALTGILSGGTYYVQVTGDRGAASYQLVAETAPFYASDFSPKRFGLGQTARLTITGTGFDETTRVEFVNGEGVKRIYHAELVSESTLIVPVELSPAALPPETLGFPWALGRTRCGSRSRGTRRRSRARSRWSRPRRPTW